MVILFINNTDSYLFSCSHNKLRIPAIFVAFFDLIETFGLFIKEFVISHQSLGDSSFSF